MKKAVIYARVSSIGDRQDTTSQVVELQDFAKALNYDVANIFECHISGAKKLDEQPVLKECLEYCYTNKIDTMFVWELSRLSRNLDTLQKVILDAKEHHLNIWSKKDSLFIYDQDGKENQCFGIMIAVLGTCAQIERENIYARLTRGRNKYIADGGKLGRREGYRKSNDAILEQYKDLAKEIRANINKQAKGEKTISYRKLAKLYDVSINTVIKVKEIIENGKSK